MRCNIVLLPIALAMVLAMCSCGKDSRDIDPVFQPYVDLFFEEAQKRGLDMKEEDYSFSLNFGEAVAGGVCYYSGNRVEINEFAWSVYPELSKQYLIFHELGHCLLDRRHDNQVLRNGECKSIMKGHEENECRRNSDNFGVWRDYYLDELFNEETLLPSWYTSVLFIEIQEVLFEVTDSLDHSIAIDCGITDPITNIEFEAIFKDWEKSDRISLEWSDQSIMCGSDRVSIMNRNGDIRYYLEGVNFKNDTNIRFVRKEGFDYYIVDQAVIHMEEAQDNPVQYPRMGRTSTSTNAPKILMSMSVGLL